MTMMQSRKSNLILLAATAMFFWSMLSCLCFDLRSDQSDESGINEILLDHHTNEREMTFKDNATFSFNGTFHLDNSELQNFPVIGDNRAITRNITGHVKFPSFGRRKSEDSAFPMKNQNRRHWQYQTEGDRRLRDDEDKKEVKNARLCASSFMRDGYCGRNPKLMDYGEKVDNRIRTSKTTKLSFIKDDVCSYNSLYDTFCFGKNCDKTPGRCLIHGTCCDNVVRNIKLDEKRMRQREKANARIKNSSLVNFIGGSGSVCRTFDTEDGYLMIRKCPRDFSNNEIRMLCEEDVPAEQITLDVFSSVTDASTEIFFYNRYCAECNRVKEISLWNTSVECKTYVHVMSALNETDLLRQVLNKTDTTCHALQTSKDTRTYNAPCNGRLYRDSRNVISSCNVCGPERNHNPLIERECVKGPSVLKERVVSHGATFKNVYCLLCNRMLLIPNTVMTLISPVRVCLVTEPL